MEAGSEPEITQLAGTDEALLYLQEVTSSAIDRAVSSVLLDRGIVTFDAKLILDRYYAVLLKGDTRQLGMLRQVRTALTPPLAEIKQSDVLKQFCCDAVTALVSVPLMSIYWNVSLEMLGFPPDFEGYARSAHDLVGLKVESLDALRQAIRSELGSFLEVARLQPPVLPAFLHQVGLYRFPFQYQELSEVFSPWSDDRFLELKGPAGMVVIEEFYQPAYERPDGSVTLPPITVRLLPAMVWRTVCDGSDSFDFLDLYGTLRRNYIGAFPWLPDAGMAHESPALLTALSALIIEHIRDDLLAKLGTDMGDGATNSSLAQLYARSIRPEGACAHLSDEVFAGTILTGGTMALRLVELHDAQAAQEKDDKMQSMLRRYHYASSSEMPSTGLGIALEEYCASLFLRAGFDVKRTPATGDQGADLIVTRAGECTAIQVKNYTQPVGNNAVQEALGGAAFYGCARGIVIAPSGFTRSARDLAASTGVMLADETVVRRWADTGLIDLH